MNEKEEKLVEGMTEENLPIPTGEELKSLILNLPEKIRRKEQRLITDLQILEEVNKNIKEKEDIISEIILNEVDDKDKKRFPNQTSRDIELVKRLSFLDGFGKLKAQRDYLSTDLSSKKVEVAYLKRMFEAYTSIASIK